MSGSVKTETQTTYRMGLSPIIAAVFCGAMMVGLGFLLLKASQDVGFERVAILVNGVVAVVEGGLAFLLIRLLRLSNQCIVLDDDSVSMGRSEKSMHAMKFSGIGRITERRQTGGLSLWDKQSVERIKIDDSFQQYKEIRQKILEGYEQFFKLPELPLQKMNSINNASLAVMWFGGLGVLPIAVLALNLARQSFKPDGIYWPGLLFFGLAGIGFLFVGALVLRGISKYKASIQVPLEITQDTISFPRADKVETISKSELQRVDLTEFLGGKGKAFTQVTLVTKEGKEIDIRGVYGSVPELFLTLRAWLKSR